MITKNLRKFVIDTLKGLIDKVESGECDHLQAEDLEQFSTMFCEPKLISTEQAISDLNVSRNKFYILRDAGIIPNPAKRPGISSKLYTERQMKEIREYLKQFDTDEELDREIERRMRKIREQRSKERRKL